MTSERSYSLMTAILFWCGLVVVSSLYTTIPLVSVFADAFEVTLTQATWTSSVFSFCYAVGFLFFGPLSDRYGRKQIILIGLGMLTVVSPIIGFFDSLSWLIALRAIQGIAAATFAPAALAYVVEMFPAEKRITTIGFVSTGFLMSGIVGQVISSLVSQYFGWNYVFYILGGVYLITTVLAAFFIPKGDVLQVKGNILAPFKQMGKVFIQKDLFLCYVVTITLLLSFVGMYTALGSYLSGPVFGLDSQNILYVRSIGILGMLVSPISGRLVTKFRIQTVLIGGLSLAVIGLAILGVSSNLPFLVVMSVVFVAGISITVPTLISLVGQLGGAARGIAVSLYTFILFIGATLGPVVAVGLLKTGSYLLTFEVLALLLGIGLIVSFLIKSRDQA
ncbi:MFS transporter [Bacillus sp. V3-13]|uniref:MFS transporter n=1 Tax=Bacillus sp. V3-13 TaxID=2053728 RepID=UPI000C75CC66|nr:MFS transporter [Bacillus sp. V3-13]PLR76158.1 MFS transporter [Bacillus sp. V3-13]